MRRLTVAGVFIFLMLAAAASTALAQNYTPTPPPPPTTSLPNPVVSTTATASETATPSPSPTPSSTTQTGTARPSPTKSCPCVVEAQGPPTKPFSFSIWWLILIPLFIIACIAMFKIGQITGGEVPPQGPPGAFSQAPEGGTEAPQTFNPQMPGD